MPRTIESLQQIIHGLYPDGKAKHRPYLLVRCVLSHIFYCCWLLSFSTSILMCDLGMLCEGFSSHVQFAAIFLFKNFFCFCFFYSFPSSMRPCTLLSNKNESFSLFRNAKDENIIPNLFSCKQLEKMAFNFAQGSEIPQKSSPSIGSIMSSY